jgi:hypothetical protein
MCLFILFSALLPFPITTYSMLLLTRSKVVAVLSRGVSALSEGAAFYQGGGHSIGALLYKGGGTLLNGAVGLVGTSNSSKAYP